MVDSHKNKTVVDAVNSLQGELHKCIGFNKFRKQVVMATHKEGFRGLYAGCYSVASFENGIGDRYWIVICTTEEFNQCVAEMSEGLFVPDCRPNNPEIQYDDEGKGWEIGAVYEFSDDGDRWALSELEGIKSSSTRCKYLALGCEWQMIRVVKNILKMGDIHKKPVELVDGGIYQFAAQGQRLFGVKDGSYLVVDKYQKHSIELCADIIKLVPESV
jgi:hypothetical protein